MNRSVVLLICLVLFSCSGHSVELTKKNRFLSSEQIIQNEFSAQEIYDSLSVEEYFPFPDVNRKIKAKSVGGLVCVRSPDGYGKIGYTCGLTRADSFCKLTLWGRAGLDRSELPSCINDVDAK